MEKGKIFFTWKNKFLNSRLLPLGIFFFGVLLSLFVMRVTYLHQNQMMHIKAKAEAESKGRWFNQSLDKRIAISETIAALIYENSGDYEKAVLATERIYKIHRHEVSSLQYAPDGKVSYIYPHEGNEAGYIDLFADKDRMEEAAYARDKHMAVLAGPFRLKQGGNAFAIRNPVYIMGDDGEEHFWGFAIVITDSDDIIEETGLRELKYSGFEFRLTKTDLRNRVVCTVAESTCNELPGAERFLFYLPGYTMELSVIPTGGWTPWYMIIPAGLVVIVFSILVSMMMVLLQKTQAQNLSLRDESETDALTGLLNRRGGDRKIQQYLDEPGARGILMAIDIDVFKRLNDLYGHAAGDRALIILSEALQERFGEKAIYIRNGGDEFLVFLPGAEINTMKENIERIGSRSFHFQFDNREIRYTISIGYVSYPESAKSLSELCRKADAALYFVKMNGRESAVGFEPSMNTEARAQLGFNLMDIASGIPGAILVYRAYGQEEILFANQGLVDLFECKTMNEFMSYVGSSFRNVPHPDDRERVTESIWTQVRDEKNLGIDKVDYRIITKKGNVRYIKDIGRLVHSQYYGDLFYVFLYDSEMPQE